jgi:hypothetical protein
MQRDGNGNDGTRDDTAPTVVGPGGPVPRSAPTTAHATGAARGYGRADPTVSVTLPPPLPGAPAQPLRRRGRWPLVVGIVGIVAAVGLAVAGGVVVLTRGGPSPLPPPTPQSSVPNPPATGTQARLDEQVRTDAAAVAALVDRWVPQLYAERPGARRGAVTMDAESVMRDVTAVKAQFPGALLLASGDFTSFAMPGYYVVVAPNPFASASEVLAWCEARGRTDQFCFAKRISKTAGPDGSTVYRN